MKRSSKETRNEGFGLLRRMVTARASLQRFRVGGFRIFGLGALDL